MLDLVARILSSSFTAAAREYDVTDNALRKRLSRAGIPVKRDEMLRWYEEQTGEKHPSEIEQARKQEERKHNREQHQPKKVRQLSLDGQCIAEYPSMREAERQAGVRCDHISRGTKGKQKTAGGYKWELSEK